jgi:hypothetical protein
MHRGLTDWCESERSLQRERRRVVQENRQKIPSHIKIGRTESVEVGRHSWPVSHTLESSSRNSSGNQAAASAMILSDAQCQSTRQMLQRPDYSECRGDVPMSLSSLVGDAHELRKLPNTLGAEWEEGKI